MAHVRVYVPLTPALLRRVRDDGGFGDPPLRAHALTAALQEALDGADQEEGEYAALTAASLASIALLTDEEPPRRVVAAVDVPSWEPVTDPDGPEDPSAVEVRTPVTWRRLAAVHVDAVDAAGDVAAARSGAEDAVERCLDHELGWFAVQEVDDVLAGLNWGPSTGRATIG